MLSTGRAANRNRNQFLVSCLRPGGSVQSWMECTPVVRHGNKELVQLVAFAAAPAGRRRNNGAHRKFVDNPMYRARKSRRGPGFALRSPPVAPGVRTFFYPVCQR
jgi:hypothetical protein